MEPPDPDKKEVRRPMNAFLIFCKRHRSMVREKNPNLDNRSVTRILGDLWANLKEEEKTQYTDLAKQYKDAFMKANPDYKWHNPEKGAIHPVSLLPRSPTKCVSKDDLHHQEQKISPGKLADPSNMGGLSLLLMAGQQKPVAPGIHLSNEMKGQKTSSTADAVSVQHDTDIGHSKSENEVQSRERYVEKEAEDDSTVIACGKVVMDHIIDRLYSCTQSETLHFSKTKLDSTKDHKQAKHSESYKMADCEDQSFLKNLSLSRDELERRLLLSQQGHVKPDLKHLEWGSRNSSTQIVTSLPPEMKMMKNNDELSSWKMYKRKRCYSEGCNPSDSTNFGRLSPLKDLSTGESEAVRKEYVDDDTDSDNQPVRKSKRRNRGQRYQELINEGIIQPSKDRQSIAKTSDDGSKADPGTSQKDSDRGEHHSENKEDSLRLDVLSVYPRQIRKRTQSESEKVRLEDSSRYKTGDFDLEAHIATLPACSLEKLAKPKKVFPKPRSNSERSDGSDSNTATEIKLSIPPHLKVKATELPQEPVTGSRKRKARKHSITHLTPVISETKVEEHLYKLSSSLGVEGHITSESHHPENSNDTAAERLESSNETAGESLENSNDTNMTDTQTEIKTDFTVIKDKPFKTHSLHENAEKSIASVTNSQSTTNLLHKGTKTSLLKCSQTDNLENNNAYGEINNLNLFSEENYKNASDYRHITKPIDDSKVLQDVGKNIDEEESKLLCNETLEFSTESLEDEPKFETAEKNIENSMTFNEIMNSNQSCNQRERACESSDHLLIHVEEVKNEAIDLSCRREVMPSGGDLMFRCTCGKTEQAKENSSIVDQCQVCSFNNTQSHTNEVINCHLGESRGERSQVQIQTNQLQTVNS